MGQAILKCLGLSVLAGLVLIIASDLPYIGTFINLPGLNWVIWIGVWAWLADRFVKEARTTLSASENPAIPGMAVGALLGVTSGLVGQLFQLITQEIIMSTAANHAVQTGSVVASSAAVGSALSAFGSLIAIFVYPPSAHFGAVCSD